MLGLGTGIACGGELDRPQSVYDRFTEGFGTAGLKVAKDLVDAL